MSQFLFLELLDRDLNLFFRSVELTVNGRDRNQSFHLTLRGPYKDAVPPATVRRCRKLLAQDVLEIQGVGSFENPREHVVFLKVASPNLRRVWWKPDYPISTFGFNPHLSLYRGSDGALAKELEKFFQHQNLRLLCAEFQVTTYVTKQAPLFGPQVPTAFVDTGRIPRNLLERLHTLVLRHRRAADSEADPSRNLPDHRADGSE